MDYIFIVESVIEAQLRSNKLHRAKSNQAIRRSHSLRKFGKMRILQSKFIVADSKQRMQRHREMRNARSSRS